MAKNQGRKPVAEANESTTTEEKAKRKMLTPAERVAKLEAELEAARKRAEEKANSAANKARERKAKLVEKRDALNAEIAKLDEVIGGDAEGTDESATETTED